MQIEPPKKNIQTAIIARIKIQSKQLTQQSQTNNIIINDKKNKKQTFLFRCQLDALNWTQKSNEKFASSNGLHHACGHDAHMAMILVACKHISKKKQKLQALNRQIIFCFQPGQQGKGGAKLLKQNYPQLFQKQISYCFAIHSANHMPRGYVSLSSGNISANSSKFQITIKGKGCHVMIPQNGIDANFIGCGLVMQLYMLKGLKLSPLQQGTLSVVKVEGGGSMAMVSENFKIQGTLRMLSLQAQNKMKQQIQVLSHNYCRIYGATASVNFIQSFYRSVYNNPSAVSIALNCLKMILPSQFIKQQLPSFNGQDFCEFSQNFPSCYINFGSALENSINNDGESQFPLHSNRHRLDERFMYLGFNYWINLAFGQY